MSMYLFVQTQMVYLGHFFKYLFFTVTDN